MHQDVQNHATFAHLSIHQGVPDLDSPPRSTDCEHISSTGSALTKIASLKKEGEQLWTQLGWARVRDDSGIALECATTPAGAI